MAVIKVIKKTNYTVMSNCHLRDMNLSNKTRGLLATMLSLPPNWNFTTEGLCAICKDGLDGIRTQLQELEKFGYLVRTRERNEKGQLKGAEFLIYEEPHFDAPIGEKPMWEIPTQDNPTQEEPTQEKPTQINKEILNKEEINNDSTKYPPTNLEGSGGSRAMCEKRLKEKFEYDLLINNGWDSGRLDDIIKIMADVFCSSKPFFVINGSNVPRNDVVERLLMIDESHIEYIFDYINETKPDIKNPRAYFLSALFNAPMTMDSYITSKLQRMGVI